MPRLRNSITRPGRASSITVAGVYDLLHFFNAGLVNSYSAGGQVGYNYQKTARDTISLIYRFDALRYGTIF
jgi:hypothetical protein